MSKSELTMKLLKKRIEFYYNLKNPTDKKKMMEKFKEYGFDENQIRIIHENTIKEKE